MVEPHPVRLVVTDDLKRSRLTVLFRFLLVIPHLIWITLWSFLVYVVTVVNWVATIVLGRSPRLLHNHLAAYLIYSAHVSAYFYLIADPYPGFTSAHSYPVTVEVNAPAKQKPAWRAVPVGARDPRLDIRGGPRIRAHVARRRRLVRRDRPWPGPAGSA